MLTLRKKQMSLSYIILYFWLAYIFGIILWKIIWFFYIDVTLENWFYFYLFLWISFYSFLCQNWLYEENKS